MKRIKSILSFVLIFFLTLSLIPTDGVYAITGSLKSGGTGSGAGGYGGSGNGDSGLFAFRIKAIPMNPSNISYSHFNVDWNNKTVTMKSNVYNSDDEKDYSSWKYITPINADRAYRYVSHGREHLVSMSGGAGSPTNAYHKLVKILGVKDGTKIESWDEALRNYNGEKGVPIYNGDELGKFFGVKDGGYYIVVERLRALVNQNGNQYDSKDYRHAKFTWFTYRDFKDMQTQSLLHLKELGVGSSSMKLFSDVGYYINQGDVPPANYSYTKDSAKWAGHAVYFDPNLIDNKESKVTLNIIAEYQGKVKENNGAIHSKASVVKRENDLFSYWDSNKHSFKPVKGNTEKDARTLLQISDNVVKARKPYTIFRAGDFSLRTKEETNLDDLVNFSQWTFNTSKISWATSQLTGSHTVGYKVIPSGITTNVEAGLKEFGDTYLDKTVVRDDDKYIAISKSSSIKTEDLPYDNFLFGDSSEKSYNEGMVSLLRAISVLPISSKDVLSKSGNHVNGNKRLGVSVSYLVKADTVESNKITVNIHVNKNNKATIKTKESANKKYTNLDQEDMPISPKAKVVIAVPYETLDKSSVKSTLSKLASKDLKSPDSIISSLSKTYKNIKLSKKGGIDVVTLGCDPDTIKGYTIYEILINAEGGGGGGSNPDLESGKVELPAYMLNRYFPNIINTSSGGKVQYQVGKDFTVKKELYKDQATCPRCGSTFFPITQPHRHQDWNIEWRDQSSSGYHIALDNKSRDRYFPSMPNSVWGNAKRSILASWTSQNTEGWSDPSGKIIDYGFNLIRASVKDNKALSGIAYKTYDVVDKDNVLQFKPYFGVSPVSSPLKASSVRSSMALAGKVSDTITVASRYTRYHGSGFDEKLNHHFEPEIGHTECGKYSCWWVVDEPEVNIYWYTFPSKIASGIRINGSSANSFTYTFDSNVRKYQTAKIDVGENEKISGGSTAVNIHAFSPKAGEVADGNEYRFANVRYNGVTHNFYPEVNMVYKIDGTQYDGNSPYRIASTMGEVLRKSKSSSLYLFKLNGVGQTTTGVTYSDSALGGTVSRGSKGVVIPAGADVHIKAEPKNITLDLYGYALDSINADTDSTFKPEKFTSHSYTDIVASGKNVDTEWNGRANRPALIKHFSDWADNILDIRNFSADFELHVNGIKKASNFSAVVGDIKRNKSITEDGVYQLQFKKGSLLSNRDYSLLIKQIASDYQCSESEAEGVFKASGIYTSILNAIESSTSDINNSGKAQLGSADWTDDLGSDGNWYDEYVNTFVVRRFTNKGNKINSITATDKIDYGLAPTGRGSTKQNANYGNTNDAKWTLNMFFNPARAKEVKDLLVDRGSFYDPSKRWSKLSEARDSFTVLMHGVRVQRADFGISADSTKDF